MNGVLRERAEALVGRIRDDAVEDRLGARLRDHRKRSDQEEEVLDRAKDADRADGHVRRPEVERASPLLAGRGARERGWDVDSVVDEQEP